jgi:hypothetical protein
MLNHTVRLVLRSLARRKGPALLNLSCLAVGIACAVFIYLWVADELSYDRFHAGSGRIFLCLNAQPDGRGLTTRTPVPLGPAIRERFPEVEACARYNNDGSWRVKAGDRFDMEYRFVIADPDFFRIFTFRFVEGDPAAPLPDDRSLVLTTAMARKYFGEGPALGRTLNIDKTVDSVVSSVVEPLPHNSHLEVDFVVPPALHTDTGMDGGKAWNVHLYQTYLLLRPGTDPKAFQRRLNDWIGSLNMAGLSRLELLPVEDIHLRPGLASLFKSYKLLVTPQATGAVPEGGDRTTVLLFAIVGLFILLTACINFINLGTAHSISRSRETGMRKVLGATEPELVRQFLVESLLMAALALALALALVEIFLPGFNRLTGKPLEMAALLRPGSLMALAGITLATGLLSGLLPALALASFPAARALRGVFRPGPRGARLRKGFVALQFGVAVMLLVGAFVARRQVVLLETADLGYDPTGMYYCLLGPQPELTKRFPDLKAAWSRVPGVEGVTGSNRLPINPAPVIQGLDWDGKPPAADPRLQFIFADPDFPSTFRIPFVEGGVPAVVSNSPGLHVYLLNESAASVLDARGRMGMALREGKGGGRVTGIVRDFHLASIRHPVSPLVMLLTPSQEGFSGSYAFFRLGAEGREAAMAGVRAAWERVNPDWPFEAYSLEQDLKTLFTAERQTALILQIASAVAVVICALGLLGLAAFLTRQRSREIGIRKVLGASLGEITRMVSREYALCILAANGLAWPAAWWLLDRWLAEFAVRVPLTAGPFLLAAAVSAALTLGVVLAQASRVARTDPAQVLRHE